MPSPAISDSIRSELRSALTRFTVLRAEGGVASSASANGLSGIGWLPVLGILVGAFACTLHHPLAVALFPADVALVIALGWQAFLGGFHAEAGFVGLWRRPAAGAAALFFALLLKFLVFRQFYPDAMWRLLLLSSVSSFCAPILVLGRLRGEETGGAAISTRLLVFTWLLWLATVFLLAVPAVRSGVDVTLADRWWSGSAVIVFALVAQLFVVGHIRMRGLRMDAEGIFSGSLIVDVAVCAGYVSAAHRYL